MPAAKTCIISTEAEAAAVVHFFPLKDRSQGYVLAILKIFFFLRHARLPHFSGLSPGNSTLEQKRKKKINVLQKERTHASVDDDVQIR